MSKLRSNTGLVERLVRRELVFGGPGFRRGLDYGVTIRMSLMTRSPLVYNVHNNLQLLRPLRRGRTCLETSFLSIVRERFIHNQAYARHELSAGGKYFIW